MAITLSEMLKKAKEKGIKTTSDVKDKPWYDGSVLKNREVLDNQTANKPATEKRQQTSSKTPTKRQQIENKPQTQPKKKTTNKAVSNCQQTSNREKTANQQQNTNKATTL